MKWFGDSLLFHPTSRPTSIQYLATLRTLPPSSLTAGDMNKELHRLPIASRILYQTLSLIHKALHNPSMKWFGDSLLFHPTSRPTSIQYLATLRTLPPSSLTAGDMNKELHRLPIASRILYQTLSLIHKALHNPSMKWFGDSLLFHPTSRPTSIQYLATLRTLPPSSLTAGDMNKELHRLPIASRILYQTLSLIHKALHNPSMKWFGDSLLFHPTSRPTSIQYLATLRTLPPSSLTAGDMNKELHRLPIASRILYQTLSLIHKALHNPSMKWFGDSLLFHPTSRPTSIQYLATLRTLPPSSLTAGDMNKELHRLPIASRILYQTLSLIHKALHNPSMKWFGDSLLFHPTSRPTRNQYLATLRTLPPSSLTFQLQELVRSPRLDLL
ncbi:uncharacterized protein LOC115091805 [Rhinatrema bivittatum]|uniref:uncharacterized protein LOC115091805 n=1 Tax=Rhinatrema bivittatum TaxID=194408 RepID=UPI001128E88A|nr:uncharacterized protein LOC115091805 [Rhinatrema bivittatum]